MPAAPLSPLPRPLRPLVLERSGVVSAEKSLALALAFAPLLYLGFIAASDGLGARPVSAAIHFTGLWTLRFLIASLAVTPLRRTFAWNKLILARRTIGLAALGYGLLHIGLFFVDQGAARAAQEIVLRVYLVIGAAALLMLLALGLTSTNAAIRRMGAQNWSRLHRLAYLAAALGTLHFFFQSKLDVTEPTVMAGILVYLLGYRVLLMGRGGATTAGLVALAGAAALATAGIEAAWYALATRVDPQLVLEANLSLDLGPRPMWWILAGGLLVAALAAVEARRRPQAIGRRTRSAARDPRSDAA
ncbi:ferric reductase-like transmembrane domain-containing protein [Xanthobacter sp. KR7-225]|uniref:sulfite oxidase heme-binding subunit YedZ n=1 Tax=Xanthobacter sp. KR7-225 TaxID=3156613 RepID=UPI0032B34AD3